MKTKTEVLIARFGKEFEPLITEIVKTCEEMRCSNCEHYSYRDYCNTHRDKPYPRNHYCEKFEPKDK
jgi:hypothetical protein